ncbi:UPF0158 family protein [Longimicrobium sp.]|uniref:UPF0158 family protein n=1 Tax=Longimicrobium sp. TaxID=2029185 RepID=UPI003B3A6C03
MSRISIDLDELCVALSDHDSEWVLDTQTGGLLIAGWLRDSEWREMGIEIGGDDPGDDPLEGDRFIMVEFIGSSQGFRWMEDFALEQENEQVRERLLDALDRPRPFRQFRDALNEFPEVRGAWHRYEDAKLKASARAWLASHDIDADVFEATPPEFGA